MEVLAEFRPDFIPDRGVDNSIMDQDNRLEGLAAFLIIQLPSIYFDESRPRLSRRRGWLGGIQTNGR
jgi:hypothetical protein